jgi:hypothetical protein
MRQPPDSRIGPATTPGRSQDSPPPAGSSVLRVTQAAVSGRRCDHCAGPLPPRRRRFCSDPCRRRGHRAERVTENETYAAAVVRQIRSMGVRASADLDALQWLAGAADYARAALAVAVDGCRARGYSDGEIGAALGITRQAVGQRFGRKRDVHIGTPESGAAG